MDMSVAKAGRVIASPYARRLAGERSIALEALSGSGPAGRIVAADILSFVAPPTSSMVAAQNVAPCAIAATIGLENVYELLSQLCAAGGSFELVDLALRAAECARAEVFAGRANLHEGVALEIGLSKARRQRVFANATGMSLTQLHQNRVENGAGDEAEEPALLSLRIAEAQKFRMVAMPLLQGRAMRLAIDYGRVNAECTLFFDAVQIEEEDAVAFLVHFTAGIEAPLRLLV
tara:strand:- start:29257 stop:29955 length:699 start_codon:yes stop_codon:yes gene_type:complete